MAYLKKIDLFGFKSFPDRQEMILKRGINVIIGPNGSGKSNVLDALLWGLGETRISTLRGTNTQDIIFNGNHRRKPMASAEVSLVFTLSQDDEEKVFLRKSFRDGESVFRINSQKVRLKDLTDDLYSLGLGDRRYFFIEQGMVGSLATMGPLEKRSLLEEAAGISRYREKKREATLKLIESQNNLTVVENILKEVETERLFWEKEWEKLLRYRTLKTKYRDLRRSFYRIRLEGMERRREELLGAVKEMWKRLEELRIQQKGAESELARTNSSFWTLQEDVKAQRESCFRCTSRRDLLINLLGANGKRSQEVEEALAKNRRWEEESGKNLAAMAKREEEIVSLRQGVLARWEGEKSALEDLKRKWEKEEEGERVLEDEVQDHRQLYLEALSRKTDLSNRKVSLEKLLQSSKQKREHSLKMVQEWEKERDLWLAKGKELSDQGIEDFSKPLEEAKGRRERLKRESEGCEAALREAELHYEKVSALSKEYHRQTEEILKKRSLALGKEISLKGDLPEALSWFLESLLDLSPAQSCEEIQHDPKRAYILSQGERCPLYDQYIDSPSLDFLPPLEHSPSLQEAVVEWRKRRRNFITGDGYFLSYNGQVTRGEKQGLLLLKERLRDLDSRLKERERERDEAKSAAEALRKQKSEAFNDVALWEQRQREEEKRGEKIAQEKKLLAVKTEGMEERLRVVNKEILAAEQEEAALDGQILALEEKIEKLSFEEERLLARKRESESRWENAKKARQERLKEVDLRREGITKSEKELISLEKEAEGLKERKKTEEAHQSQWKREALDLERERERLKGEKEEKEREKGEALTLLKAEEAKLVEVLGREGELKALMDDREKSVKSFARKISQLTASQGEKEVEKAALERDLINLEENLWNELTLNREELLRNPCTGDEGDLTKQCEELKEELDLFADVRFESESELTKFREKTDFYTKQKVDVEESILNTQQIIEKIDQESKKRFSETVEAVNQGFREVFAILFPGGSAEVTLLDPEDLLNTGVELNVRLPGKRLQNLQLLSGGEKALASLAFLFAMFRLKPAPICVLDEIDAPLDEINVESLKKLLKTYELSTQFILITHHPKTMEVADAVFGITMKEPGVSTIFSIDRSAGEASPA